MHTRRNAQSGKVLLGVMLAGIVSFHCSVAGGKPVSGAELVASTKPNKYYTVNTLKLPDGTLVEEEIISGPPAPPPGFEVERQAVSRPVSNGAAGIKVLTVPAFKWVFGCSAVSGAMIAGYYDRNGFPDIYTGPTDSGVMPLNSNSWTSWSDGEDTYQNCPLIASKNGVDGRASRGSIDDYWYLYGSSEQDPYITGGWAQHAWGDAIGDYMKTSQSAAGNTDGGTKFWHHLDPTPYTCADLESYGYADGTLGRKLFYEARGYAVSDCYNQRTDNVFAGGFSFAQYKAEIDAGRPVLLNLDGHSIVGIGYDDSSNTVYLHDTWDYGDHTMTWGGSYSGMALRSVSIVNMLDESRPPTVTETVPANDATGVTATGPITATFSQPMDASTITASTFTLMNGNTAVAGSVNYNATTRVATFTPAAPLAPDTVYTAAIGTGVTDRLGKHLAVDRIWSFVTSGHVSLIVNGGFEAGVFGWTKSGANIFNMWRAGHNGSDWFAELMWYGNMGITMTLHQDVTIPANATAVGARFWHVIESQDTTAVAHDILTLTIKNPTTGAVLQTLATLSNLNNTNGLWSQSSLYDLLAYRGQTIRLTFTATTNVDGLYSYFAVDDVEVTATVRQPPVQKNLTITINGNGSVNSDPAGLACTTGNSGSCSAPFPSGTQIVLMPTAGSDSMFSAWAGGCTSENNGNCNVTLLTDRSITATYAILPPVFTGGSYYESLQSAYDSGTGSCTMKAKAVELPALAFTLNSGRNVALEGGYDSTYSLNNNFTTMQGMLTLETGSLTVENLIIK